MFLFGKKKTKCLSHASRHVRECNSTKSTLLSSKLSTQQALLKRLEEGFVNFSTASTSTWLRGRTSEHWFADEVNASIPVQQVRFAIHRYPSNVLTLTPSKPQIVLKVFFSNTTIVQLHNITHGYKYRSCMYFSRHSLWVLLLTCSWAPLCFHNSNSVIIWRGEND